MSHRCVEDVDGGEDDGDEASIAMAATFSSSLSFPEESPLELSMSVSQSPTIYALPFFFLWYSFFLPPFFLYGFLSFFSSSLESSCSLFFFFHLSFLGFGH